MNKSDALKRLDAIETEAAALRKIIDGKIEYKDDKLYVGTMTNNYGPHILVGYMGPVLYRFQSFRCNITQSGWAEPVGSAQECIDNYIESGGTVHEFDNVRDGFEFFLANYKA